MYKFRDFRHYIKITFVGLSKYLYVNKDNRECELVIILPPESAKGWILDGIFEEVAARCNLGDVTFVRHSNRLPLAKKYIYSHYMYYVNDSIKNLLMSYGRSYVYATHLEPEKHLISDFMLTKYLKSVNSIFCMNTELKRVLVNKGIEEQRLEVSVGAANPSVFYYHERIKSGAIGFCSSFYDRKCPDMIYDIVKVMPNRSFILLGRDWKKFGKFEKLKKLKNFTYIETAYENYNEIYSQMSVFVSVSKVEGGPIPLLEAMMSNIVPVVRDTGFAKDIITPGYNGFIFGNDAAIDEICALIEQALKVDRNIRDDVLNYSWDHFSTKMLNKVFEEG
jgi:glycosyltransferase involved in cell wall biosynthesis